MSKTPHLICYSARFVLYPFGVKWIIPSDWLISNRRLSSTFRDYVNRNKTFSQNVILNKVFKPPSMEFWPTLSSSGNIGFTIQSCYFRTSLKNQFKKLFLLNVVEILWMKLHSPFIQVKAYGDTIKGSSNALNYMNSAIS